MEENPRMMRFLMVQFFMSLNPFCLNGGTVRFWFREEKGDFLAPFRHSMPEKSFRCFSINNPFGFISEVATFSGRTFTPCEGHYIYAILALNTPK